MNPRTTVCFLEGAGRSAPARVSWPQSYCFFKGCDPGLSACKTFAFGPGYCLRRQDCRPASKATQSPSPHSICSSGWPRLQLGWVTITAQVPKATLHPRALHTGIKHSSGPEHFLHFSQVGHLNVVCFRVLVPQCRLWHGL